MSRSDDESLRALAPIEDIIRDASNGRMFILVDDEVTGSDWAWLAVPAQMATPDILDFMAAHGKGQIGLSVTPDRWRQLGLPLPSLRKDGSYTSDPYVSIDAREGVTGGTSASDRARTISVAIGSTRPRQGVVSPGHVRLAMARDGGVLVRAGHCEAAVDIARLAGLNPSSVLCAIQKDDGYSARMLDLIPFAREYGMGVGRIRDLIDFRYRHDRLVEKVADVQFASDYGGDWRLLTYRSKFEKSVVHALVKGRVDPHSSTLVRLHAVSFFDDMMGQRGPGKRSLQRAMLEISKVGVGVIVLTVPPSGGRAADLAWRSELGLRANAIGTQILIDLGISDPILLTKEPETVAAGDFGAKVVGQQTLPAF